MVGVILFLGAWNTPLPNIGSIELAELDNRRHMGYRLDNGKNIGFGWCANVDQVDTAAFKGRSTDEFMLEGIDPAGIYMYAGIGDMADIFNVAANNLRVIIKNEQYYKRFYNSAKGIIHHL